MDLANSIVTLQPGMYILRHPKTGLPPLSISRAVANPTNNGRIQAIHTQGTEGSILRDGRDCIVMHVMDAPVDLLVTAYLPKAGAAVPSVKIDKVALEGEAAPVQARTVKVPAKGMSLVGHVERKGDIVATGGQTLGFPKENLRLEGFQVAWPDKPEGVDVTYSARIEGGAATATVASGNFCGTRNAAKRIVGVTFALTGPKASQYALDGTAHFSGGYAESISSGAALRGPSGMEHLTGVSLQAVPAGGAKAGKGAWDASARTKIFKAAAKAVPAKPKK